MKKRLLSILLCFVMVLGLLPITASAATATVPNARIEGDYLKWDAVADASYYCVFINYSPTERVSATAELSFDLKNYCKDRYPNKYLNVQIAAYKENGSALTDFTSAGSYANTAATKQQLTTPGNVQWNGFNVTWNPVANATGYTVILTREYYLSGSSYSENYYRLTTTTNSINIREYCVPDIEDYRVSITATADGYLESEKTYGQKTYTEAELSGLPTRNIQNVTFDHATGILSWNPFADAARYEIEVYTISPLSNYYRISATGYITQSTGRMTFDVGAFCYEHDFPKSRDYFSDCHVLLTAISADNREISAKWQIDNYKYNYSYGHEVEPLLDTTVTYSGAARYGQALTAYVSGLPVGVGADKLSYQWQYKEDSSWVNIGGANALRYPITEAMIGKEIRAMVTVEGYLSALYGAPVTVQKNWNMGIPVKPELTYDATNSTLTVNDPKPNQEYCWTTTASKDSTGSAVWPTTSAGTGNSISDVAAGTTYYVYTRIKESATLEVGRIISAAVYTVPGSVSSTGNPVKNVDYPDYPFGQRKIYIPVNDSVTVTYRVTGDTDNPTDNMPIWKVPNGYGITVTQENGRLTIAGSAVTTNFVAVQPKKNASATDSTPWYFYGANASTAPNLDLDVYVYNPSDLTTIPRLNVDGGTIDLYVGDTYDLNFAALMEKNFLPVVNNSYIVNKDNYALSAYVYTPNDLGTGGAHTNSNDSISISGETITANAVGENIKVRVYALADGEANSSVAPIATYTVNVIDRPTVNGLVVMPQKVTMKVGETRQLTASTSPANAVGDITWDSEDTDVVTVDNTGKITAVANGVASVYAVCGDVRAYSVVTVKTMCDNHDFNIVSMGDDSCTATCVNCGYTTTMEVPTASNTHPNNRPNSRPSRPSGGSSTTATVNSAKTGDVGIALYAVLALTSYTGSALVIRGRKRK